MNERIRELARTSHLDVYGLGKDRAKWEDTLEKFAELIVRECVNTLEFHGFDDAIPYIKWMATNKLGIKE